MPHFRIRLEFSFLYSSGQLCAGVPFFEGILLHGFLLQDACFLGKGETFENEQSAVEIQ
jgi:hypothetical protein